MNSCVLLSRSSSLGLSSLGLSSGGKEDEIKQFSTLHRKGSKDLSGNPCDIQNIA